MFRKYTLIGSPLGHSMSPWIHEHLFAMAGRQAEYTLTEISPEDLQQHMPALKSLTGFNITIPHKISIIPYLQTLDETAQRYHSVNCVHNTPDGSIGYNTDCEGFLRSVQDFPLDGKVLLIGCGGVGRMMATEAIRHKANLTISEPNQKIAKALKAELENAYPGAKIRLISADQLEENFDLLMNACPVGMYPKTENCPVNDAFISRCSHVFDVIYNPTETVLIQKAKAMQIPAVGGAAMLVWQAVRAHEIWDGDTYTAEQIQKLISDMEQEIARLFPVKESLL